MGGYARVYVTSIVCWDAATACSYLKIFYATIQAISGRQIPTHLYRQLHSYSTPEKRPLIIPNCSEAVFLLFPPCLCCYSTYYHCITSLLATSASPQPIRAQNPPDSASNSQTGLKELQVYFYSFLVFFFLLVCARRRTSAVRALMLIMWTSENPTFKSSFTQFHKNWDSIITHHMSMVI